MVYIYDFGDDWKHTIELVEITNDKVLYPVCIQGKGCNMIDDCGGVGEFYNMVEAVNDNKHSEHKEIMEWLGLGKGDTWDLLDFDLESTNSFLRKVWDIYIEYKSK